MRIKFQNGHTLRVIDRLNPGMLWIQSRNVYFTLLYLQQIALMGFGCADDIQWKLWIFINWHELIWIWIRNIETLEEYRFQSEENLIKDTMMQDSICTLLGEAIEHFNPK